MKVHLQVLPFTNHRSFHCCCRSVREAWHESESLTAYDEDLNMLWQHAEHRAEDYFGHYIYPYDVNGDGIDEVIISHLCLDAKGHEVWNNAGYFQDNHDHMDAMEFLDINGDGKPELMVGQSDVGTLAYNAQNGDMIWHNLSDHSQQITAGWILDSSKTPQVVTNGRTYTPRPPRPANASQAQGDGRRLNTSSDQIAVGGGLGAQLYWFDSLGRQLEKWPAHPLSGNPNFVRGDWYGTGKRTFFGSVSSLSPTGGPRSSSRARSTICSTSTTPAPSSLLLLMATDARVRKHECHASLSQA